MTRSTALQTSLFVAGCLAAGVAPAAAQATPASAAKAQEVVELMAAKKLDAFATRDGEKAGRYVAALIVPNVQLLVVSAAYSRENDIEYSIYNKLYQNAYLDLKAGALATDRFFVDDALGNGLIALPGKNPQHDAVTMGTEQHVFDGQFAKAGRRNDKKIPEDVYMKTFADAETRYSRLLDMLIAGLKKNGGLAAAGPMR